MPAALRTYATEASTPKRLRSPWMTTLFLFGAGCVGYGLYDLYKMLTLWPPELRDDLRSAIQAKHKGEFSLSEAYFQRAWEIAQALALDVFGREPYLKLSGILIALADAFEVEDKQNEAYDTYVRAYEYLVDPARSETLTPREQLRVVAVATKLGEMAEKLKKPQAEEEKYLEAAVNRIVKVLLPLQGAQQGAAVASDEKSTPDTLPSSSALSIELPPSDEPSQLLLAELDLPEWVTIEDVGAPLQNAAAFYTRIGRYDLAMPLYLHAISLLIPPAPRKTIPQDRCRGAQMMVALSEAILRNPKNPQRLEQAYAWCEKALEVVQETRKGLTKGKSPPEPLCEVTFVVVLFSLGMVAEAQGDKAKSHRLLSLGIRHARSIGLDLGDSTKEQLEDHGVETKDDAEKEPVSGEASSTAH
ncbi:hypothetical protein FISHEDRAFT_74635 [Fistulina hepatica ATCC 64428]|uniref:TPR-like protein n=1 Tax=Fistulina hepatica ATCC 64428 TaxID=1128425 RepID=A0A0D7AC73_9AGAR|nr:hypothetical protein FISHEDRAFT_74635 [Fistulina hepatica ATCC 64428]